MTARQVQLIQSEAQRHIAMAKTAREISIKCSHVEVAEALGAALQAQKGGSADGGTQAGHDL
ncbi:MAG: hypothetical protein IKB79_04835 [Oscillospiraceae bacterium]|nr:hypothetical protein [Oscillospiraceae bacterium]